MLGGRSPPDPVGELQCSPDPITVTRGGERGKGKERVKNSMEGRGGKGRT